MDKKTIISNTVSTNLMTEIKWTKSLDDTNLPKLSQGEKTDNLNKPISIEVTESMIDNLPKQKANGSCDSLINSAKHLREKNSQFSMISSRK
jgi:hypothetical protein